MFKVKPRSRDELEQQLERSERLLKDHEDELNDAGILLLKRAIFETIIDLRDTGPVHP